MTPLPSSSRKSKRNDFVAVPGEVFSLSSPLWPQGGSVSLLLFQLKSSLSPTLELYYSSFSQVGISKQDPTEYLGSWREITAKQTTSPVTADEIELPAQVKLLLPRDLLGISASASPSVVSKAWRHRSLLST